MLELVIPTTLYRLFGADDILIYIGITDNLRQRMNAHAATDSWWPTVHYMTATLIENRAAAEDAEWLAILAEKPVRNVAKMKPRRRSNQCPVIQRRADPTAHEIFQAADRAGVRVTVNHKIRLIMTVQGKDTTVVRYPDGEFESTLRAIVPMSVLREV